jgi:hypothetical protein
MVFVRVGSHRAHEKLERALGQAPCMYFSHYHAGQLAQIPEASLVDALQIKGISRANPRDRERWHRCWEFAKPK